MQKSSRPPPLWSVWNPPTFCASSLSPRRADAGALPTHPHGRPNPVCVCLYSTMLRSPAAAAIRPVMLVPVPPSLSRTRVPLTASCENLGAIPGPGEGRLRSHAFTRRNIARNPYVMSMRAPGVRPCPRETSDEKTTHHAAVNPRGLEGLLFRARVRGSTKGERHGPV